MMMLELHLVIILGLICVGFFQILKFINEQLIISLSSFWACQTVWFIPFLVIMYRLCREQQAYQLLNRWSWPQHYWAWSSDQIYEVNIIWYAHFTTNWRKPHSPGIEQFDFIRHKLLLNEFGANNSNKSGGSVMGKSVTKLYQQL